MSGVLVFLSLSILLSIIGLFIAIEFFYKEVIKKSSNSRARERFHEIGARVQFLEQTINSLRKELVMLKNKKLEEAHV